MAFLALIAINRFLIDPMVISSMDQDKLSADTAIQGQMSLHDTAAEGTSPRTGILPSKHLAVQNIWLFQWVLPAVSVFQLHSANGKQEGGFQMLLLLCSFKITLQWHFCPCLFPLFSALCSLSLLLTDAQIPGFSSGNTCVVPYSSAFPVCTL